MSEVKKYKYYIELKGKELRSNYELQTLKKNFSISW